MACAPPHRREAPLDAKPGQQVGGPIGAALLLDHFGALAPEPRPVTVPKLAGLGLMLAGAWLIARP